MQPNHVLLRCFAEQEDGRWVAYCLDLSLVAQAETLELAKLHLEQQIRDYVADALVGEDRQHAAYLLQRRAPLSLWLRYVLIRGHIAVRRLFRSRRARTDDVFNERIALSAASPLAA